MDEDIGEQSCADQIIVTEEQETNGAMATVQPSLTSYYLPHSSSGL